MLSRYITQVGLYLGSSLGFRTQRAHDHDTTTQVSVRRVTTADEGEHVQMEVTIHRKHKTRVVSSYGYIHLTPKQAALMAKALTELQPRTEHTGSLAMAEQRKLMQEHYGLTDRQAVTSL